MNHTIIAQGTGLGKIFRVRMPVATGGKEAPVFQEREVAVIFGLNEDTGRTIFVKVDELPNHLHISDLPEISLATLEAFEPYEIEGSSLKNTRKRKTSKPAYSVQGEWEKRGAVPGFRIPKK